MDEEYKIAHEEFVSHLNGTSPEEVLGATLIMPISSVLLSSLMGFLSPVLSRSSWRIHILLEYITLTLLPLLALTVWSEHIWALLWTLLMTCVISELMKWSIEGRNNKKETGSNMSSSSNWISRWNKLKSEVPFRDKNLPFITAYRCQLLQSTAISILAVDFPVFPRRFAKTEIYGWSIMDAGVGSFVIINALVSSQSKGRKFKHRTDPVLKSLVSSSPILLLGITRLIIIKITGYPEHITEYGIHWNFFFTLALTKIVCTILLSLVPLWSSGLYAIITGTFYQLLLSYWQFDKFLLSDERSNIIEANKEGFYSLFGYAALYFSGVELGKFIYRNRDSFQEWLKCSSVLFLIGSCTWMLMCFMNENMQQVSRRMANLPYCLWMISLNSLQVGLQILVSLITAVSNNKKWSLSHEDNCSQQKNTFSNNEISLWEAINANALFYFLFSNILTGIVNIFLQTIRCSTQTAIVVLGIYMIVVSITPVVLYKYSIKTKVW